MKKVTLFIACFFLAFATSGFAAGNGDWTKVADDDKVITCGATETLTVTLSPRVEAIYFAETADSTNTGYAIATRNVQGTRTFGTNNTTSGIYYEDGIGVTVTKDTNFASDWKPL